MLRRFVAHLVLGALAGWVGSVFVPNVHADGAPLTFLLLGFLLAAGEVVIGVAQGIAAVLLFFLPRGIRLFALRIASVGVTSVLTSGFGFDALLPGLVAFTLFLSVLYWLPLAR